MRRAFAVPVLAVCCLQVGCAPTSRSAGGARPLAPLAGPSDAGAGLEEVGPAAPLADDGPRLVVSKTGVVLPVLRREGNAFRVMTPCGNEVGAWGVQVTAVDVVLDPGHGGEETGAVGPQGLREKDLNLVVAAHAAKALQAEGVSVLLTRRADYRMTLAARGLVVAAVRPKAFVSIHHNAGATAPSSSGPGTEVYHQQGSADSERLSGVVYEDVKRSLSATAGVPWVATERPGVVARVGAGGDDYYGVLRRSKPTPAALVEGAYLSNGPEETLLQRPEVQKAEGAAIARGILRYLHSQDPGSGFLPAFSSAAPAGGGGGSRSCEDPAL